MHIAVAAFSCMLHVAPPQRTTIGFRCNTVQHNNGLANFHVFFGCSRKSSRIVCCRMRLEALTSSRFTTRSNLPLVQIISAKNFEHELTCVCFFIFVQLLYLPFFPGWLPLQHQAEDVSEESLHFDINAASYFAELHEISHFSAFLLLLLSFLLILLFANLSLVCLVLVLFRKKNWCAHVFPTAYSSSNVQYVRYEQDCRRVTLYNVHKV